MATTVTPPAASSPAVSVPREPQQYAEWRMSGKLPEAAPAAETQPKEASATSSEEGHQASGKAPDSETGKQVQEKKPSKAETRLNELLDDLRRAGLSPAELKTFKREMQKDQQAAASEKAPPEKTAKPAGLEPPKKPKVEDFKTYEEFEAAKDDYHDKLSEYRAKQAVAEDRAQRAQEASEREMQGKIDGAKTRYGDAAESTIGEAAHSIFGPKDIPAAVKAVVNDSPVLVDLLYVMGSKAEDLAEFVALAKSNPSAAIRKAVLLEHLVTQELAKGGKAAAEADGAETPVRGADGKFTKEKAPEKKATGAPPPPKEVSGRSSAPPDEVESSFKAGDVRGYMRSKNAKDIARRQGR